MTSFADGMLDRAYRSLDTAASAKTPNTIYVAAFLAASHAAAAVISSKISPEEAGKMRRPGSLWAALTLVDPDLTDWAQHFSARARKRDYAEKDVPNAVQRDQAEELLDEVHQFVVIAEGILSQDPRSSYAG